MCIFIHSSKGEILRAFLSSSRENIVSGNPVLYQRWPPKTVGIFIHSSKGEILLAFLSSSRENILSGNPVFFSSEMATKNRRSFISEVATKNSVYIYIQQQGRDFTSFSLLE